MCLAMFLRSVVNRRTFRTHTSTPCLFGENTFVYDGAGLQCKPVDDNLVYTAGLGIIISKLPRKPSRNTPSTAQQ